MRSVENEEYGKCGMWKTRSVWKFINFDRFIHLVIDWYRFPKQSIGIDWLQISSRFKIYKLTE